jgi:HEAT repeat protein
MRIHKMRTGLIACLNAAMLIAVPMSAQIARTPAPLPPDNPRIVITSDRDAWLNATKTRDIAVSMPRLSIERLRDMDGHLDGVGVQLDRLSAPSAFDLDFAPDVRYKVLLPDSPRAAWATADPADSLYRVARQSLNAGEYRRAAQLFAQINRQFPTSQYRADATYWRAFALYRIGGLADLHEALQALDSAGTSRAVATTTVRTVGPGGAFFVRSDEESAVLAMRIRGALAARGDATAAAQIAKTADGNATACDDEDAELRIEALNALVQMDPKNADPAIAKVLARRDSCAAPLRRGAITLVARSKDPHTTDLLITTARSDPAIEVRAEAIRWLGNSEDDRASTALGELATSPGNPALQRIAVRALASQDSPAAHQAIRTIMIRTDVPSDVRVTALHYAGKTDITVADLAKMYDSSTDRQTREEIISLLEQRQEPAAADKLIDILRTSTDPSMRGRAMAALSRKKDPRTTKLLMDILDK